MDGSFRVVMVPGLNADALGRPLEWSFAGNTGGGVTDHFPVEARFTVGDGQAGEFVELVNPSTGDDALDFEMPLGYEAGMELALKNGAFLKQVADSELGQYVGRLYRVDARVLKLRPMTLDVGGVQWAAYAPDKSVYAQLKELKATGESTAMVVKLGIWKGKRQFVVEGVE